MEEKKVGLLERLKISMFKLDEYDKLKDQKVSNTILTFVLIGLIQVIVVAIYFGYLGYSFDKAIKESKMEIPNFEISSVDGLTTDMEEPFEYYEQEDNVFIAVNDDITIADVEDTYSNYIIPSINSVIVTQDGMVTKDEGEITELKYSELELDKSYTKADIIKFANEALKIVVVILLVTIFINTLIVKFIGGLILALVAQNMGKSKRVDLSFGQAFNIAMYSGVLTTIVSSIIFVTMIFFPFWGIAKLIVILVYINSTIKRISKKVNNLDGNTL